jgi:PAS domain S-box-containing protein
MSDRAARDLAAALAPHHDAILNQLALAWRTHAPKNTVMLGSPQQSFEVAGAIGAVWFDWLNNLNDLAAIRELAARLLRAPTDLTYALATSLAQALSAAVTHLTAGDEQRAAFAVKLTRRFSDAFLDQVARQHELHARQAQERLAAQLQAGAEVGRAAASILDTGQLLREVVNLITDRFGFYYAAVFTLEPTGQHAMLREATGQAGEILKNLQHQLDLHGPSLVSAAITSRQLRIAADSEPAPRGSGQPLLPDTRSEIALPLVVGNQVLGALDVQSTEPRAFDEISITVLRNMADQIAIALANAHLFGRTQAALRALQHEQGLLRSLLDAVPDLIFYKDRHGVYLGCNTAFEAFVGRSARELAGRTDHDLYPADIADVLHAQDQQLLAQRAARRIEEWVTYPDGRRVLLDTLKTPFANDDGEVLGLIGVSRDITARTQADRERVPIEPRTL